MQPVTSSTVKNADNSIRAHNPDLFSRREAYEQSASTEIRPVRSIGGETTEVAPNPYMMLISRIDGQLAKGGVERGVVEQLRSLLSARIAGLTPAARRNLLELPQARALGVEDASRLPAQVANGIQDEATGEAAMNLLRDPAFAAAMKDESRISTYGPRGFLRAS